MSKQYPLPLPHIEAMEADDFMVADSNREAMAWIDKWPNWSVPCLVIIGPSGSGKTHLTHVWLSRSHGRVVKLGDLSPQNTGGLIERGVHMAIDDADTIAGDAAREEALFHLYNRVKDAKGGLLLTARQAPAQWKIELADLRSRLLAAPTVELASPDDELLRALLIKQFHDRQIDIRQDVVDYLLPRVERSPAAIRTLVTALDHASLAEGRRITIALARQIISPAE